MSDGGPAAIVCGFSDLAAGVGGVAWELGGRSGLLLNGNEVQEAEVGISPEGEGVRLEMRTKGAEVEATLVPSPGTVEPRSPGGAEPPGGALEAAICTATVRSKGWGRTFQCSGAPEPLGRGSPRGRRALSAPGDRGGRGLAPAALLARRPGRRRATARRRRPPGCSSPKAAPSPLARRSSPPSTTRPGARPGPASSSGRRARSRRRGRQPQGRLALGWAALRPPTGV